MVLKLIGCLHSAAKISCPEQIIPAWYWGHSEERPSGPREDSLGRWGRAHLPLSSWPWDYGDPRELGCRQNGRGRDGPATGAPGLEIRRLGSGLLETESHASTFPGGAGFGSRGSMDRAAAIEGSTYDKAGARRRSGSHQAVGLS